VHTHDYNLKQLIQKKDGTCHFNSRLKNSKKSHGKEDLPAPCYNLLRLDLLHVTHWIAIDDMDLMAEGTNLSVPIKSLA